jgi:hypothetical protein
VRRDGSKRPGGERERARRAKTADDIAETKPLIVVLVRRADAVAAAALRDEIELQGSGAAGRADHRLYMGGEKAAAKFLGASFEFFGLLGWLSIACARSRFLPRMTLPRQATSFSQRNLLVTISCGRVHSAHHDLVQTIGKRSISRLLRRPIQLSE